MTNNFAIKYEQRKHGKHYVFVDTSKATLRNMPWTQLGDWGKRKFENMLFLTHLKGKYVEVKYV